MPDINLLADTKQDQPRKPQPKRAPPVAVEYSAPSAAGGVPNPLRKPSGFGLWFRSLFRGRTPKRSADEGSNLAAPRPPARVPFVPRPASGPEPEDIFADIHGTSGGPARPVAARPAPSGPTGRPPGEFPPLPKLPPWNGSVPASRPPPSPGAGRVAGGAPSIPPPGPPRRSLNIPPPRRPSRPKADEEGTLGGVNLLPEELVTTYNPRQKLTTIGLVALATALVVGIVDLSLLLWKETQVRKTNEKRGEVAEVMAKIKSLEKEQREAITLKASNDIIRQLLNRHVYWTKLLERFERYTLPTVFYPSGITVDLGGTLNLVGSAPDIETILQQLAIYQQATDLVKTVTIDTISREGEDSTRYSFVADFTLAPTAFYRPIDQPTVAPATNINAAIP